MPNNMIERCQVKRCGVPADHVFHGHGICSKHWMHHLDGSLSLKKILKLKDAVIERHDELHPVEDNQKNVDVLRRAERERKEMELSATNLEEP